LSIAVAAAAAAVPAAGRGRGAASSSRSAANAPIATRSVTGGGRRGRLRVVTGSARPRTLVTLAGRVPLVARVTLVALLRRVPEAQAEHGYPASDSRDGSSFYNVVPSRCAGTTAQDARDLPHQGHLSMT
jgi:hypothetical protein